MTKPSKVNVSLNPETMELLTQIREELGVELGFTPSYAQVIQHLIGKRRHHVADFGTNQGVSHE
jgi:ABC-type phosphate/phosphonate transport system substrate-binding protein